MDCLSCSHFGKNINRNVSSSKQTRQELNTCTAPSGTFLRAHISRSRHEHIMQRIQTFHHQNTNLITNRWGHFANLYKHKPRIPMKKQEVCLRRKPHEHQLLGDKPPCSSSIKPKVGKAVSTSSNFLFHQRCTMEEGGFLDTTSQCRDWSRSESFELLAPV